MKTKFCLSDTSKFIFFNFNKKNIENSLELFFFIYLLKIFSDFQNFIKILKNVINFFFF